MKNTIDLKVGDKIKIGALYAEQNNFFTAGQIIELIKGHFEYDNGLYIEDQYAPAIWSEEDEDYDSIYHLFGNNLEDFMDCEIVD